MQKIAIVRRNGLGDLLCAYPLILYIRKEHPKAKITLFVDAGNAPLLPFLPQVDHVVLFPAKGNKYLNAAKTAFRFWKQFDIAISAKTSPMKLMNFFLFCTAAKDRIAYIDENRPSRLINKPIPYCPQRAKGHHQSLKTLHLLERGFTHIPEEFYPKAQIPEKILEKYKGSIPKTSQKRILCISATTTREASRLSCDIYARIINRLSKNRSFHVLITCQPKDETRAFLLSQKIEADNSVHFPRCFEEFMVLLNAADVYFVGDGGIAHIGAALGKKNVVLFGETNPREWSPLSNKTTCFYHPKHVDCIDEGTIYEKLLEVMHE